MLDCGFSAGTPLEMTLILWPGLVRWNRVPLAREELGSPCVREPVQRHLSGKFVSYHILQLFTGWRGPGILT